VGGDSFYVSAFCSSIRAGDSNSNNQGSCYSSKGSDFYSGGTGFESRTIITQSVLVSSG
jgi:hypothetical protein